MLWSRFALRYMFSPKSHSVINIIAWVSLIAVAVPTAAVIILLAMFEGLTGVINELDTTLDGDIEIVAQRGQTFDEDALDLALLSDIDGVESITSYIEQSVMASATGRRIPITIRGVEPSYYDVIPANKLLVRGNATSIFDGDIILGASLASSLAGYGIGTEVELYALNRRQISTLMPSSGISHITTHLGGVVSANVEVDESVALMERSRIQQLLNYDGKISTIAIRVADGHSNDMVAEALRKHVGAEFKVLTRDQKNASINAILRMEKFAIILIGALIALIATFSIVGSVIMLMTEKQRDMATLKALGAHRRLITNIFVGEGILLTATGCIIGATIGIALSLGQMYYGWVTIPGGSFLSCYPVELNSSDVAIVIGVVMMAGIAVSWLTVRAKLKNMEKSID